MTAESINSYLCRKHYGAGVSTPWISALIASKPGLTADEVYKVWLTTDIRDTHISALPDNVSDIVKTEIKEPLTLQVLSVLNVGASMYSQLRKIEGKEPDAVDFTQSMQFNREPPSSRMLFLDLSDGTNRISGMEYRHCPQMSVNTLPGTKIIVSNAVCRMGLILLEPGNFRILGGCVEKLRLLNTQKNLLSSELHDGNVEEDTNNPPTVTSGVQHAPNHTANNPGSSTRNTANNQAGSSSERGTKRQQISRAGTSNKSVTRHGTENMQIDKKPTQQPVSSRNNNQVKIIPGTLVKQESEDFSDLLDDITDEFFDAESELLDEGDMPINVKDITPSLAFPVTVTATISTLSSKLSPKPEWTVNCKLSDFVGTKEFRLSEAVLAKLIGFTSTEFTQLQPVSKTNPQIKTYLRKGLENCQNQLTYMTGRFEIQLNKQRTGCEFEISRYEELTDKIKESELKEFVLTCLSLNAK